MIRRVIYLLSFLIFTIGPGYTQTARVQFIHNSPDGSVDYYLDGAIWLNDFGYLNATPFVDFPAGQVLQIDAAPDTSTSAASAFASFTTTLEAGKTYIFITVGRKNSPTNPFTLIIDESARETAVQPDRADLGLFQGSPDAPSFDVALRVGPALGKNQQYKSKAGYQSVLPETQYIDFKLAGSDTIAGTYQFDLSSSAGQAAYIFTSGNFNVFPPFGVFVALPDGTVYELFYYPVARVQFINNFENTALDLYSDETLVLDNLGYRKATPYLYIPADQGSNLGFALDTSTSTYSSFAFYGILFKNGGTYTVTSYGSPEPNSPTPFSLFLNEEARESAKDTGNTDITFQHLAPQTPAVNIDAVYDTGYIVNTLPYGAATIYYKLESERIDLSLRFNGSVNPFASYRADLRPYKGRTAVFVTSGLPNGQPGFALLAVFPDGTTEELPLTPLATIQLIHNAADPTVDIYAGKLQFINDMPYRTATLYLDVPANRPLRFGIAPGNSFSSKDAIASTELFLNAGQTYAVFLNGLPFNSQTPLAFSTDPAQIQAVQPTQVEFAFLNGSPDAPALDLGFVGGGTLVTDLGYGEYGPFYYGLAPQSYTVQLKESGSGSSYGYFLVDLTDYFGQAFRMFTSGLSNGTPAFGLFGVFEDGTVVEFPRTTGPPTDARIQLIQNSTSGPFDVYANGELIHDNLDFREATPFIELPGGTYNLSLAPDTSKSAAEALYTTELTLLSGGIYTALATGILYDQLAPFYLIINANARDTALLPFGVDAQVFHSALFVPNIDLDLLLVSPNHVQDLSYGQYTGYFSLNTELYDIAVRPTGSSSPINVYRADLSNFAGQAVSIFASGQTSGAQPAFGLFMALPDGTVVELPATPFAKAQIIHNAPDPTVDVYAGTGLLLDDVAYRTASPYLALPADRPIPFGIAPSNSTSSASVLFTLNRTLEKDKVYTIIANGIPFNPDFPLDLLIAEAREQAQSTFTVEWSIVNGAPGAPAITLGVSGLGNLITDLTYTEFSEYFSSTPSKFKLRVSGASGYIGTYTADFSAFAGKTLRLFTSSLPGAALPFRLFAAVSDGQVVELPLTPTARGQFIQNTPVGTVDVYLNGSLWIDNFAYRTATPFLDVLVNDSISVALTPDTSLSINDAFASFKLAVADGEIFTAALAGLPNSGTAPLSIALDTKAVEEAKNPALFEFSVLQGALSPATLTLASAGSTLADQLSFASYSPYSSLPPAEYIFSLSGQQPIADYQADLKSYAGRPARLFTSGTVDDLRLFAAFSDGLVIEFPRLAPPVLSAVQIIQNSLGNDFDLYLNGQLLRDNFAFGSATPYSTLPAGKTHQLALAPASSSSINDTLTSFQFVLDSARTYTIVINGQPGNSQTPISLAINNAARTQSLQPDHFELTVVNGLFDPALFDLYHVTGDSGLLSGLKFNSFSPYLSFETGNNILELQPAGQPDSPTGLWSGNFSSYIGQAGVLLISGSATALPLHQLWLALPNGATLPLAPLARVQVIHNSPSASVDVYLNNDQILDNLAFRRATPTLYMPARQAFSLKIAPDTSTSASSAFYILPVNSLVTANNYLLMAAGQAGSLTTPFQLYINTDARIRASQPGNLDLLFFTGAPDIPVTDLIEPGTGLFANNLGFGKFAGYYSRPAADFPLRVSNADSTMIFGNYIAELAQYSGQAITLFTSGLANGSPAFETWVALTDGFTFPLKTTVATHQPTSLPALALWPNPVSDRLYLSIWMPKPAETYYRVFDLPGRESAAGSFGLLHQGTNNVQLPVDNLHPGIYQLEIITAGIRQVRTFVVQ